MPHRLHSMMGGSKGRGHPTGSGQGWEAIVPTRGETLRDVSGGSFRIGDGMEMVVTGGKDPSIRA